MKFSWKLLNHFINLKNIKSEDFKEKLTLCGIEVEHIEKNTELKDQIIYLNIPSNRKEIFCVANLAKEISIILNIPLKIQTVNLKKKHFLNTIKTNEPINKIEYFKLYNISNIKNDTSPSWLIKYIKASNIIPNNLWKDLEEYIYIKWGCQIKIINNNQLDKQFRKLNITSEKQNNINIKKNFNNSLNFSLSQKIFQHNQWYNKFSDKVLFFALHNDQLQYFNENEMLLENYVYAEHEIINIISTFTKSTIGKPIEQWKHKIYTKSDYSIKVRKSKIHNILGSIQDNIFKLLSTKEIMTTLQKLQFNSIYYKNLGIIKTNVPHYRVHDLKREIDIIEEIGRIHGFEKFSNSSSIPITNKKGKKNNFSIQIQKTRILLRNLGLNEVINSSLVNENTYINEQKTIKLYNPISNEQKILRNNIIENLIINYQYNIKHKNSPIEIFEIGKIFEQTSKNKNIEKIHLGGLIYNEDFIRNKWSSKTESINWFHVKGTIEALLEQLDSKTLWKKLNKEDKGTQKHIQSVEHLFHPIKKIGIYNSINKQFIGIVGELNPKYNNLNVSKKNIYIFEINTSELYKTINKKNKHLKHSIKTYSQYPSVTRDISLKIYKNNSLSKIKKTILKTNEELIKSINIFNEYYDKKSNIRSIGLRITYQAKNRTLNNKDIQDIDINIKNLLSHLK